RRGARPHRARRRGGRRAGGKRRERFPHRVAAPRSRSAARLPFRGESALLRASWGGARGGGILCERAPVPRAHAASGGGARATAGGPRRHFLKPAALSPPPDPESDRAMNILVVTEQFTFGGLETQLLGFVRHLQRLGHRVSFAVSVGGDSPRLRDCVGGRVLSVPLPPAMTGADGLAAAQTIADFCRREGCDFLHLHP